MKSLFKKLIFSTFAVALFAVAAAPNFMTAQQTPGTIPANAKWDSGDDCNGRTWVCAVVKPGINE